MKLLYVITLFSIVCVSVLGARPPAAQDLVSKIRNRQTSREEILKRANRRRNQLQPRGSPPPTECQNIGGGTCLGDGDYYQTMCNQQITSGTFMSSSTIATFGNCINNCDISEPCGYVSYYRSTGDCSMYSSATTPTYASNPDYDSAYGSGPC